MDPQHPFLPAEQSRPLGVIRDHELARVTVPTNLDLEDAPRTEVRILRFAS